MVTYNASDNSKKSYDTALKYMRLTEINAGRLQPRDETERLEAEQYAKDREDYFRARALKWARAS